MEPIELVLLYLDQVSGKTDGNSFIRSDIISWDKRWKNVMVEPWGRSLES